jgi:hypothetical protein
VEEGKKAAPQTISISPGNSFTHGFFFALGAFCAAIIWSVVIFFAVILVFGSMAKALQSVGPASNIYSGQMLLPQ